MTSHPYCHGNFLMPDKEEVCDVTFHGHNTYILKKDHVDHPKMAYIVMTINKSVTKKNRVTCDVTFYDHNTF